MFRKLFVFGVVLLLVLCSSVVLEAVFYTDRGSDSAIGNGDPPIENFQENIVEEEVPVSQFGDWDSEMITGEYVSLV